MIKSERDDFYSKKLAEKVKKLKLEKIIIL